MQLARVLRKRVTKDRIFDIAVATGLPMSKISLWERGIVGLSEPEEGQIHTFILGRLRELAGDGEDGNADGRI